MSNWFVVEINATITKTKFNPARVGAQVSGDGNNTVGAVDITRGSLCIEIQVFGLPESVYSMP